MSSVTIKTLQTLIPLISTQKNPILIRGRHGIGKSELVKQFANSINRPLVEKRPSQMTEGDWTGLPNKTKMDKENITEWCIPEFLQRACREGVVLFLDEIDRAPLEVRQGIFQLGDSRRIDKWELHPDTLLFAACNSGENTSQYLVGDLDPAELDRWTVFDLEPTVEEWIEWGKSNDNIHPLILSFIFENPKHLEHEKGSFEPSKKYPSRRSWKRLSDNLISSNLLNEENKSNVILLNLSNGYVGFEASLSFVDYIKNYKFQVSPEEIVDKGEVDKTKDFGISDYLALNEKIILKGYFSNKLTKKQYENISRYFVTLPAEIAMKFLINFGKEGKTSEILEHNLKNVHHCNNNLVQKYIAEILSNPDSKNLIDNITNNK